MVDITMVRSKRELREFIRFPYDLYRDDKCWVPDLYINQKALFNKKTYPFFLHSKADLFLAWQDKKVAGRIAVIRNNNHIAYSGERCGFFGFFETNDVYEVAKALLDTAVHWTRQEGLSSLIGPENYTTNDSCGILVEGFGLPPVFMMPYNKPYYQDFFEKYGFSSKLALVSYSVDSNEMNEKLARISVKAEERLNNKGITIRPINMNSLEKELLKLRPVYNTAYKDNWGFVPLTEEEFLFQARELKKIADPGLILFAEKGDQIIGFICAVPDINQVLIKIRNGRLLPFGLFKLIFRRKKISNIRLLILGLPEDYRNLGIDAVLYSRIYKYGRERNILTAEAAYVMENNYIMNNILKNLETTVRKRYKLYEYTIPG